MGAVRKDPGQVRLSFALAFPDAYEIGMSHVGLQILYAIINQRDDLLAERTYTPWPDMADLMRQVGVPLYALESFRPVREFDVFGISLQTELCFSNVLEMLDLAGIPLRAANRGERDPLVLGGGPSALCPEPVAAFFDAFILGDGEDAIVQFADAVAGLKERGAARADLLDEIARALPFVYVPSLYEVSYQADGVIAAIEPTSPAARVPVRAALVEDLDAACYPIAPLVPNVETIHDRIGVEILRGCAQGCRFCQAGMTKRPVRPRTPARVLDIATQTYAHTGHDEVALQSLSSSDYEDLGGLIAKIQDALEAQRVNVALPSLRVSDQLATLPTLLKNVRKCSLTVAPEAATNRLRAVINKNIDEADLFAGVVAAFQQGWRLVKLYFMIGLPTETDDDVDGILDIAARVADARKPFGGRGQVNVALSPFVPKAHTPFQWEPMASLERIREIQARLRERVRYRSVKLKFHTVERSFLEGVFARGDRRLAAVIERAWRSGCRFDQWDDHFNLARWLAAFEAEELDPAFYAHRKRGLSEVLPWDHLSAGVDRAFLLRERERAFCAVRTHDCRADRCHACGACRGLSPSARTQCPWPGLAAKPTINH